MERAINVHQQQLGVEDKHKRKDGSTDIVGKTLNTGFDRIGLGNRGGGKRCQTDWRGIIRQNTEVKHEKMHSNQWDDQPSWAPRVTITGAIRVDTTM